MGLNLPSTCMVWYIIDLTAVLLMALQVIFACLLWVCRAVEIVRFKKKGEKRSAGSLGPTASFLGWAGRNSLHGSYEDQRPNGYGGP